MRVDFTVRERAALASVLGAIESGTSQRENKRLAGKLKRRMLGTALFSKVKPQERAFLMAISVEILSRKMTSKDLTEAFEGVVDKLSNLEKIVE